MGMGDKSPLFFPEQPFLLLWMMPFSNKKKMDFVSKISAGIGQWVVCFPGVSCIKTVKDTL